MRPTNSNLCSLFVISKSKLYGFGESFSDAKDTAFIYTNNHVRPLRPKCKTVQEMLAFRLLTWDYRGIISKLEPVDWI